MCLLRFKRLRGSHLGLHQAEIVWSVIRAYGIQNRLGNFTLDNASNNDTALEELAARLLDIGIDFVVNEHRLRCFGHVLNLSVQAFMWGKDTEAFGNEEQGFVDLSIELSALRNWRSKGPLGKLHNVLVHIRRTSQSRDRFLERLQHHSQQ